MDKGGCVQKGNKKGEMKKVAETADLWGQIFQFSLPFPSLVTIPFPPPIRPSPGRRGMNRHRYDGDIRVNR